MWKKLTLIAALLGLAVLLVLPLAGTLAKGPAPPVPWGPGRIAVNVQGHIYLVNPDGSRLTWLAAADERAGQKFQQSYTPLAWSPQFFDQTAKLAYPHWDSASQTYSIRVIDGYPTPPPGTLPTTILDNWPNYIDRVDWSPAEDPSEDGTQKVRVAFGSSIPDPVYPDFYSSEVHIVGLIYDPSRGQFTLASGDHLVLKPEAAGIAYGRPRFSPDGRWLALQRKKRLAEYTNYFSIWLAKADGGPLDGDGSVMKSLVDVPGDFNEFPAWSQTRLSDGRMWLAFFKSSASLGLSELFAGPFDEENLTLAPQRMTYNNRTEYRPTWSPPWPDGTLALQIAYDREGKPNLGKTCKLMLATGQEYDVAEGRCPAWSPPGVLGL